MKDEEKKKSERDIIIERKKRVEGILRERTRKEKWRPMFLDILDPVTRRRPANQSRIIKKNDEEKSLYKYLIKGIRI